MRPNRYTQTENDLIESAVRNYAKLEDALDALAPHFPNHGRAALGAKASKVRIGFGLGKTNTTIPYDARTDADLRACVKVQDVAGLARAKRWRIDLAVARWRTLIGMRPPEPEIVLPEPRAHRAIRRAIPEVGLPVADTGWMKPITREQLMGRR
jgi:hypothetical protein